MAKIKNTFFSLKNWRTKNKVVLIKKKTQKEGSPLKKKAKKGRKKKIPPL